MFGLTKYGFKRKTYDDILQELFKKSKDTFGEDINLTTRSLYGMFLRVISWVLSGVWQLAEYVYLSSYVRYAEGISLDRIASNIGLTRLGKQYAEGYINIYVSETPLELDRGFIVEGMNNQRYTTLEPVIIEIDGQEVYVRSLEKGVNANAEANTIDTIVTPVAEVERVNNLSAIVGGKEEETDDEFRRRYQKSLSAAGSATRASIESALRQLDGVNDVLVKENDTTEYIGELPPHFIHCIVAGGYKEQIGSTILKTKAAGIGTKGEIEVNVIDDMGGEHLVFYDKVGNEDVTVYIELTVNTDYSHSYEEEIKDKVKTYINTVGVGETLYASKVMMELKDVIGIDNINVTFNDNQTKIIPAESNAVRLEEVVISYD